MTLDEGLAQAIQQTKAGTERFRFPQEPAEAYRLLMACFAAEVRHRQAEFMPTEFTLDKIWQLSLYITQQVPKFGAILCGSVGNGKTTMLCAFQSAVNWLSNRGAFIGPNGIAERRRIEIHSAKEITRLAGSDWKQFERIRDLPMLALDELGEEPREMQSYGNILSPITDLIERRYAGQMFTLISTNIVPGKLEEVYGQRIADRFREMLEVISFGGEKSFRR